MKIIHVHRGKIKANQIEGKNDPPIQFDIAGETPEFCHSVEILDDAGKVVATVKHNRQNPLKPWNATVWIEADNARNGASGTSSGKR